MILEKVNIQCNHKDFSLHSLRNKDTHGVKYLNVFALFFPAARKIAHPSAHLTTVQFISASFDDVDTFRGNV